MPSSQTHNDALIPPGSKTSARLQSDTRVTNRNDDTTTTQRTADTALAAVYALLRDVARRERPDRERIA